MHRELLQRVVRREFLNQAGLGLGSLALGTLLGRQGLLAAPQASSAAKNASAIPATAPKPTHHAARAKAVIQLFMVGGPSQLELLDYKPQLQKLNGQAAPESFRQRLRFLFIKPDAQLLGTRRKFARHGESGAEISDLLPYTARMADDLAIVRTLKTDNFSHGAAKLLTQTGFPHFGFPALGSWVLYGLGCESDDLPGYVVLQSGPRGPRGGSYLWSSGFLPSLYQGVPFRSQGDPILNLSSPAGVKSSSQERTVQSIAALNKLRQAETGDDEISTRTASYEMAFRMQRSAPQLMDLAGETQETLDLYGVRPGQPSFAMNCLLARRLVERGVRFVTLFHPEWDHHGAKDNIAEALESVCREVDQASWALVTDLKRRGLLDETLVIWGGEFGRTPLVEARTVSGENQPRPGRDHHIEAYSAWLAGGGIRAGQTIGQTDELGFFPADENQRVHVHDLQATILHLLGLDHLKLTHRFQGRDFRITDVGGNVVEQLLG
jgi:hypothetical protein